MIVVCLFIIVNTYIKTYILGFKYNTKSFFNYVIESRYLVLSKVYLIYEVLSLSSSNLRRRNKQIHFERYFQK